MNGAYLHLLLNHVPVVAVPIAMFLLGAVVWKRSRDLAIASFMILAAVGILALPVMESGDAAMEVLHNVPGIEHNVAHEHEEAGEGGTWGSIVLGVLAIGGLWLMRKGREIPRRWTLLVFLGSVVMSGWLAWVAHLGGLIRHPEIAQKFEQSSH